MRQENEKKDAIHHDVQTLPDSPQSTPAADRHQLVPPFFPSNAACNIEIAFCTLRCLIDGLVDPPNRKLPLRSEFACGGGGVGGELMLDALGEDARSRDGVSQRPSSEGVIGLEDMGIDMKVGMGVGDWTCVLD